MNALKTIRMRLLIVPTVAILAVAVTAAIGLYGLALSNTAIMKLANFNSAILHAKQADTMHDALRGDVLLALLSGLADAGTDSYSIQADLSAHLETLRVELESLQKLDLPPEVVAAVMESQPALNTYTAEAAKMVELSASQPFTAQGMLGAFMTAFEDLGVRLEKLGILIEGLGSDAAAAKSDSASFLFFALALWGLVSSAAFVSISWVVSRSITQPIGRVCEAMAAIGDGNLEAAIPDTGNQSEVGEIARSLNGLRQKLMVAAEMTDSRLKQQIEQQQITESLRIGLNDLSSGNFSRPITTPFAPDYEVLRQDFNLVVEKLSRAISLVAGSAESIRARSAELTHAADDLAHRTETQAATLEQTAAAMDQMTSSVKSSTASTKEVEAIVRQARKEAEDTGAVVKGAVSAMVEIEKSSNHISQIISVIDDIAFQTNLLALNAGVEAARAGDAGRGFAVVASEVGALAQRSSMAAKEIKTLIGDSTQNVGLGVDQVGRAGQALTSIVERVAQISTLVSNIASGAVEQSTGLGEINVGVTQLDLATQQNAAMVEQTKAASQLLSQSANDLTELMAQFVVPGAMLAADESKAANLNTAGTAAARGRATRRPGAHDQSVATAQTVWAEF